MKINTGTLVTLAISSALTLAIIAGCKVEEPYTGLHGEGDAMDVTAEGHDGEHMNGSAMKIADGTEPATGELVNYRNDAGELVCPVMGNVIASEEDAFAHYDHEGTRYYFCCGMCPDSFEADPAKYIDGQLDDSDMTCAGCSDEVTGELVEYRDVEGELACPVMGNVIASKEDAFAHYDHEGTRYYFCCGMCPEMFEADPEEYIG